MRKYGSYIRASPCADVAVKTRPPPAAAPCTALIAECSHSTWIISASNSPLYTLPASRSTTDDWGVIG